MAPYISILDNRPSRKAPIRGGFMATRSQVNGVHPRVSLFDTTLQLRIINLSFYPPSTSSLSAGKPSDFLTFILRTHSLANCEFHYTIVTNQFIFSPTIYIIMLRFTSDPSTLGRLPLREVSHRDSRLY